MRFLLLILITGFCFAEDPVKPLPKDVQTIVDAREKALSEARIAFDKAVFKANDDAVKKMETVVKTNTQKGDLDGALASKKFVEEWNKEKETVAVTGALGGAGPIVKKNDLANIILGEWKMKENGESVYFDETGARYLNFTGKVTVINQKVISIKWNNNSIDTVNYINGKLIRSDGGWTLEKVK